MSPPSLGVEEEARGISQNNLGLTERNYLGLSSCSSVDSSALSSVSEVNKSNLNLKATELRLGLPGSLSPGRDSEPNELTLGTFEEKTLFPLLPLKEQKNVTSGNKRVFSATPTNVKTSNNSASAPPAKTQVVGWPPIRSYRKNTLATSSKNNEEVDGKPGASGLFVKVSMDGAPYLRKVDLRLYATYRELSSALEKMFSCFTLGQCGSNGTPGKEMSEIKMKDLLHGSEYVVTYEDKDGDWMLVGDVPWDMFIESCKRLKIMKGSDAIGLAPRTSEKAKNKV